MLDYRVGEYMIYYVPEIYDKLKNEMSRLQMITTNGILKIKSIRRKEYKFWNATNDIYEYYYKIFLELYISNANDYISSDPYNIACRHYYMKDIIQQMIYEVHNYNVWIALV